MAVWNNATLTNVGRALQAKLLSTDKLQITRVVAGTSRVADNQLESQTAISNIAQTLTVEMLSYDKQNNAIIKVAVDNSNLTTGYIAHQIGIYATDPDKGEILYAITQEKDKGDEIPSIYEQPHGYYHSWSFVLTFGAASSVDVTIDPQHAITREEADRQYLSIEAATAAISGMDEKKVDNTVFTEALEGKVDKVPGKGLSEDNFTSAEKAKLKGIAENATNVTVDAELSAESTNPVQNKVVKDALDKKVSTEPGKGLSTNDFDNTAKNKLAGIEEGATKTTVDSTLNETSTNPVQNKAVHAALKKIEDALADSDVFIVRATGYAYDESQGSVSDIDKTVDEVYAAITAGKNVLLVIANRNTAGNYYFATVADCTPYVITYMGLYYHSMYNRLTTWRIKQTKDELTTVLDPGPATYKGTGSFAVRFNSTYNTASGLYSIAGGDDTEAKGSYSTAFGNDTTALGTYSSVRGFRVTAAGEGATAEGYSSYHSNTELPDLTNTTDPVEVIEAYDYSFMLAFGKGAHAEGIDTLAVGTGAHAEGDSTMAVADGTHAEGYKTEALAVNSHAEGEFTEALGEDSHAEGYFTTAFGDYSHAANYYTHANVYQTAVGRLNKAVAGPTGETDTTGSLFIVGNGTNQGSRANAFRVAADGKVYGSGSYNSSGADVAELWEWEDGNPNGEDRRGLLVTLNGDKIRPANADDDFILGFVSAVPCLVGNAADDWHGKYLKDVFGQPLTEKVEVPEQTIEREKKYIDEETGEEKTEIVKKIIPAHIETRYVLNPEYDPEREYIPREERKEWNYVGFHGQIVAVDDGTCQVNGYCAPSKDGIVTASATATDIRVMQRIDDTHIKVYVR